MIVLHIDTERTWRGGEQQIAYLMSGLGAGGHRTLLVAQPDAEILRRFEREGRETVPLAMRGELDVRAVFSLAGIIRRIEPDIVHMHTAHAHTLGLLASRFAGRGRRIVSRRVDFRIGALSARLKYGRGVDLFIAITRAVADVLREAGVDDERIVIVPSGIDPARHAGANRGRGRRALGLPDDALVVGTVAHFAWHKGLVHLVRAWKAVSSRHAGARLVLVGEGEDGAMLRETARQSDVESSIRFVGFRDDVGDCLAALDCFVLPSVLEGLGTSLLDALALGVPVVATRTGGIPEVISHEETGLLVPPGDEAALAHAIGRMLTEPSMARETAAAGRRRVLTGFTAEAMVTGTLAAYEAVTR